MMQDSQTADALAERLHRDGWTWGSTQAVIRGRLMWIADAHRCDDHHYIAHADTLPEALAALARMLQGMDEVLTYTC